MVRRNYTSRAARVSSKKPAILWSSAFAILVAGAAWLMMPAGTLAVRSASADALGATPSLAPASLSSTAPAAGVTRAARRIYPYSVVPGGVADGVELARVVKSDKVVAAHYAEFNVAAAREVKVSKARAVHVSYRKGDKIYWTANKVILPAGETLLSDGVNEVRTRCANRISDTAQLPVAPDEPSAEVLDSSIEEGVEVSQLSGEAGDSNAGQGRLRTFNSGNPAGGPALAMGPGNMESMESFGARLLSGSSASMGHSRSAGAPALRAPPPSLAQAPQTSGNSGQPDAILPAAPVGPDNNGSGNPAANPATNPPAGGNGNGQAADGPAEKPAPPQFADDSAENELPSRQPVKPEIVETDIGKVFPPGSEPSLTTKEPAGEAGKIPEPATIGLLIGSLAVLGLVRRRRAGTQAKAQ